MWQVAGQQQEGSRVRIDQNHMVCIPHPCAEQGRGDLDTAHCHYDSTGGCDLDTPAAAPRPYMGCALAAAACFLEHVRTAA